MLTSTRLPSGGTILASSLPSAGQDRRHLGGADVTRLGHVDDQVGHREGHDRQHQHDDGEQVQAAPDPLPVDLGACGSRLRRSARRSTGGGATARRRSEGWLLWWRLAVEDRLDDVDLVAHPGITRGRHDGQHHGPAVVGRASPVYAAGLRGAALAWTACPRVRRRRRSHRQPRAPFGRRRLTLCGALRYSLAVRAPERAVRVPRAFGGRGAPSTYDLTK